MDLFGTGGALRSRSDSDIHTLFEAAYKENPLLATKIAFYLRDVRGGQGERKVFRVITDWLAVYAPEVLIKNLSNISFFGRYDDLVRLMVSDNEVVANAVTEIVA